jgi:hypothetical protein
MNEIRYGFRERVASLEDLQAACGKGWADIIKRLVEDLFALGWNGTVIQIKEKFGSLRFQGLKGDDAIYKRINEAENESLKTCEECGAPGGLRSGGWLKTLCDEHANGRELWDAEKDIP